MRDYMVPSVEPLVDEYLALRGSEDPDEYERASALFDRIRDYAADHGFDVYRTYPELFIDHLLNELDNLAGVVYANEVRIDELERELCGE